MKKMDGKNPFNLSSILYVLAEMSNSSQFVELSTDFLLFDSILFNKAK
jgi:hypothetical protein